MLPCHYGISTKFFMQNFASTPYSRQVVRKGPVTCPSALVLSLQIENWHQYGTSHQSPCLRCRHFVLMAYFND